MMMLQPNMPLKMFAASIAKSVSQANERLAADYSVAVRSYCDDMNHSVPAPASPLHICNVKVKFRCGATNTADELLLNLNEPEGNFTGELEFAPLTPEMTAQADMEKHFAAITSQRDARPLPPPSFVDGAQRDEPLAYAPRQSSICSFIDDE